ncbi:ABC transporter permease [Mesorhizobium sp. M0923]|uniref:ABC transporter permease n=1 Tax=unclassified Mesorhizobium TaxID=325217 RepID=UPI0003D0429E|nr:ABC transporter permease [Mesorhizobium sp. L48C026A00]ESZ08510.1 hypothetical protein X737_33690 [Mesorhizobium sp. L48C026A00]
MSLILSEGRPLAARDAASRVPPILTNIALGASFPLALLLAWTLSSRYGWLPQQILPAPSLVWATFLDLLRDGSLLDHTVQSLRRVFVGFLFGAVFGLSVGAAIGLLPKVRAYVWPVLTAITQVNVLAWLPLLILLIGIDEELKYVCIGWSAAIPIILGTSRGIANIPPALVELGRVLNFSRRQNLGIIVLPASLPSLFTGLREGLAAAWQNLVIVELFASFEGLGYLMTWGRQLFQLELVIVAMLVIAAIGLALNAVLQVLERFVQPWELETSDGR